MPGNSRSASSADAVDVEQRAVGVEEHGPRRAGSAGSMALIYAEAHGSPATRLPGAPLGPRAVRRPAERRAVTSPGRRRGIPS